jgi:hypothetical protein
MTTGVTVCSRKADDLNIFALNRLNRHGCGTYIRDSFSIQPCQESNYAQRSKELLWESPTRIR